MGMSDGRWASDDQMRRLEEAQQRALAERQARAEAKRAAEAAKGGKK